MAYRPATGEEIRQGDVLAKIRSFSMKELRNGNEPVGSIREYSYSVVLTQDCDLEQDYAARSQNVSPDKLLFGVILCGAYQEDKIKSGQHRPEAKKFGRAEWKPLERNQDPRYQYLGYVDVVEDHLVVDFKDYFMVPCDFLYSELASGHATRVAEMTSPYKEHLLQRFAWYLMRVALPIDFHRLPGEGPT